MNEHKNCQIDPIEKPLDRDALSVATVAYLTIGGMGCPRCVMRVRNRLLSLDGVLLAEVQLEQGVAAAAYDTNRVHPNELLWAVAAAGNDGRHHYSAKLIEQVPAKQAIRF